MGDLSLKLPRTTHLDLRKSFTTKHKELTKEQTPHPDYLEARLQQLEEGEIRTEKLSEVVSLADDDGSPDCGVSLLPDGKLRAKRTSAKKGTMPTDTEEYRQKISLIARTWEFIRLKLPGKPYLQGYEMSLWDNYADFILGEKVAKLELKSGCGGMICRPSWSLVLEFDFEFRDRVSYAFNNKQGTLEEFFNFAYEDSVCYNTKLLTPLAMHAGIAAANATLANAPKGAAPVTSSSASSSTELPAVVEIPTNKDGKGNGKGGKRKQKGDKNTPDAVVAQQVCWKFNKGTCKDANCKRRHVCTLCQSSEHGARTCPNKKAKGGANGQGGKH